MSRHTFPTALPEPLFFQLAGSRPSTVARVDFESGIARQYRLRRFARPIYSISWEMTQAEYAVFAGFVFGDGTQDNPGVGAEWFAYQVCLPFLAPTKEHVARFTDQSFAEVPVGWREGVFVLRITAQMEFSTTPATTYTPPSGDPPEPGTISDI